MTSVVVVCLWRLRVDEGQEKEWKGGREVGGGGGGGEKVEGEGEGEGVHYYVVHTRQVELGTVQ